MMINYRDLKLIKSTFITFFISFISLLFVTSSLHSQNYSKNDQLLEYLGDEKYENVLLSNPSYLQYLNVRCEEGYHILDYVDEKMSDFQVVIKIPKFNTVTQKLEAVSPEEFLLDLESEDFNFLKYKFQFERTKATYYIIGDSGKVIMIYPVEYISKIINSKK